MSAEILINITPQECRVALANNGALEEILVERNAHQGIVGNIYHGKVSRVLPGMEAAFIDIGQDKAAFLHASDLSMQKKGVLMGDSIPAEDIPPPKINQVLHEGSQVMVQVVKDPLGTKGARLTTYVTIPSRYLVLMPDTPTIGVSSKIESEEERLRLKNLVNQIREEENYSYGFIVRTVTEGISETALRADMRFLNRVWTKVMQRAKQSKKVALLYTELPLSKRILRDVVSEDIKKILVDSRETASGLKEFCQTYIPELKDKVEHYPGERPIFDLYGVEDDIQKALKRKVQLKSGGYLIIDQTEAMTTIDVNTGGYVGHRNLEETIFKTNLEAAQGIAKQVRLRNLGGIIILDFIDMKTEDHKKQVISSLERALERDTAKTAVSGVSSLGLVEMTRKRTRESLLQTLCEPCTVCSGRGFVKTAVTVCYELFREISRESRQFDARELLVLASQDVVDLLLDEESDSLAELQEFVAKPIRFQVEAMYTQEQFDVVLL
ncbi:ribonuclease G [Leucothrix pacifica]|uniref:Ribonuclease G n=1 Tax=Leucothrix pacifica TaxID=1247513 RepID=A0A317CI13_9GAMM|nr:ribonuclease G [Leucothrix pacifica]PWQ98208.1 ribonuclease G [Leucothrix pacifica]